MKTLILKDRKSMSYFAQDLALLLRKTVEGAGSEVTCVTLNGDEILPCRGCFQCWVKTPGLCIMDSDSVNDTGALLIQSDVVIFLSEICYGGFSYDIKSFLDRIIPNIMPYFEIVNGEMHHVKRYERFPVIVAIGYGDFVKEESQLFKEIIVRNALNMRPPCHFAFTIENQDKIDDVLRQLGTVLSEEVHT